MSDYDNSLDQLNGKNPCVTRLSQTMGSRRPSTALAIIVGWGLLGPIVGFNDIWQMTF